MHMRAFVHTAPSRLPTPKGRHQYDPILWRRKLRPRGAKRMPGLRREQAAGSPSHPHPGALCGAGALCGCLAPSVLEPPSSSSPPPRASPRKVAGVLQSCVRPGVHRPPSQGLHSLTEWISIPMSPAAASVPGTHFEHRSIIQGQKAEGTAGLSAHRLSWRAELLPQSRQHPAGTGLWGPLSGLVSAHRHQVPAI